MMFFHGTTSKAWRAIQADGALRSRTYLSPSLEMAVKYGPVVLLVEYGPGSLRDNYGHNPPPGKYCWQFAVFEPISLAQVRRI